MTILQDILPHLRGWKFDIKQISVAFTIPAGQYREMFEHKDVDGYILGLGSIGNVPNYFGEFLHVGPKRQERLVTGSPFALNAGGFTVPNGSGFWCPVYNAVLGVYSAVYTPDSRIGFWCDYIRGRLYAPTATAVTISSYYHTLVVIEDREEFKRSWRELFSNKPFRIG